MSTLNNLFLIIKDTRNHNRAVCEWLLKTLETERSTLIEEKVKLLSSIELAFNERIERCDIRRSELVNVFDEQDQEFNKIIGPEEATGLGLKQQDSQQQLPSLDYKNNQR